MQQHNRYSREGCLVDRALLTGFVDQGASPDPVRWEQRQAFNHQNRAWSVIHGEKLAGFDKIIWTRTLADVHLEDPIQFCQNIRFAAASILESTCFLF